MGLVREPGVEVGVDRLHGAVSDYDCFGLKIYELVPLFYNLESTLRIIDDRNFFTAHSLMHIRQKVIANVVEEVADQS